MTAPIEGVDMADFAHAGAQPPAARAIMRRQPQDFRVVEHCPVALRGEGEHLWLLVEKTGLTTAAAAACLARAADVKPRTVGYSGLKDRHAVARQWFSLPWPMRQGDSRPFAGDRFHEVSGGGFRVLRQQRHTRKLRRGTHDANAFTIVLRGVRGPREAVAADLERIAARGVPNYFGAQRFGRGGGNMALARALFAGQRLRRDQRGFALSAARAFVFNSVLDARIRAGNWNRIMPGEAVMLAGSHSVFGAAGQDMHELEQRLAAFDIHPSGPLAGTPGNIPVTGEALDFEQGVLADHTALTEGLAGAGVRAGRRALRLDGRNLAWHWPDTATLVVAMTLPPGGYATSVLREVIQADEPRRDGADAPGSTASQSPVAVS